MRKIVIFLLICLTAAATLYGCVLADRGCKQVGGCFDQNTVFEISTADGIRITLFNKQFVF